MSEHVGAPFTAYNQASAPKVLTGNFFEERALLAATGIARRAPIPAAGAAGVASRGGDVSTAASDASPRASGPCGCSSGGSVFPSPEEKAANAAQPATFQRVIEHSEQQSPASWASHARAAHAPPAALRDSLPGAHKGCPSVGPREAEELRRLWQRAAAAAAAAREAPAPAAPEGCRATAYAEAFKAPPLEGQTLGARVMKTRDGCPVVRDPEFLVEAGLLDRAIAGRVFRRQLAFRHRSGSPALGCGGGGGGTPGAVGPAAAAAAAATGGSWAGVAEAHATGDDEPVTIYSFDWQPAAGGSGGRACGPAAGALDRGCGATAGGGSGVVLTAAATSGKHVLTQSFYGSGGPKARPMARNDQFTKLAGDVNKLPGV